MSVSSIEDRETARPGAETSTLRVLHVVATGQRRGAEMFASDLVRALDEAGVSQRVGVLRGAGPILTPYEAPTVVLGADGWRAPGLRIDPRTLVALRRLIADWRPTIVQAHGGEALKYSVMSRRRGCRIVYRRIGSDLTWMKGRLQREAYGVLMRRAARIVTLAETIRRDTLRTFRVPAPNVVTIPRGIDSRRLSPKESREATRHALGISLTAPVIVSVAALSWEKDPLAQVEIAARVSPREPELVHLLVGEGPLRLPVEDAVRRRGLEGRVLLLGSRSDIGDLLAASDLMLLSSHTEGMPGCLIEAGMTGLPAVAYAVGGVPDVVVDGVTGLLAPPGDLSRLESSVLELLRAPSMRRSMSAAARRHCRSRFDIHSIAPMYLRLYEEVLVER